MLSNRRRYWLNLITFGLGVLFLTGFMGIIYTAYKSTQAYLHPTRREISTVDTPAKYGIVYEDVQLLTSDGIELAAWYTPPKNGALILIGHGLADARSPTLYTIFADHGYGVLAWDFRAHGQSGGELSTLGYYEALDVEAALEFGLAKKNVKHIGAWGASMGGAAVIEAASRRIEIEAVVIDSTYTCLDDELKWLVNYDIFTPFIRFFAEQQTGLRMKDLCPKNRIGAISPRPVLIIQGEEDTVIPEDAAQRLFLSAGDPRYLWTAPGARHVETQSMYPSLYEEQVVGFFDTYLLQNPR